MGLLSDLFDDGTRPTTAAEDRAYDAKVRQLRETQGRGAANAWINEQHKMFHEARRAYLKAKRAAR